MFQLGINIDNEAQKPASEIAPGWDFTEIPVGEFMATVEEKEGNRIIRYTLRPLQPKSGDGPSGEIEPP